MFPPEHAPLDPSAEPLVPALVAAVKFNPDTTNNSSLDVADSQEGKIVFALLGNTVCAQSRPTLAFRAALAVLDRWYRDHFQSVAGSLLEEWQESLGVRLEFWGVKRMTTKWGSCNHQTKRVWLNSELAKKPLSCLEYIVVHELVDLLEPAHGDRFVALMDEHLPDWRQRRDLLNSSPLANESWTY